MCVAAQVGDADDTVVAPDFASAAAGSRSPGGLYTPLGKQQPARCWGEQQREAAEAAADDAEVMCDDDPVTSRRDVDGMMMMMMMMKKMMRVIGSSVRAGASC